jgi:hypothetical protein
MASGPVSEGRFESSTGQEYARWIAATTRGSAGDNLDRQAGFLPGLEPTFEVRCAGESEVPQGGGGDARRVAVGAHGDHLSLEIRENRVR